MAISDAELAPWRQLAASGRYRDAWVGLSARLPEALLAGDLPACHLAWWLCTRLALDTHRRLIQRRLWRARPDSLTVWTNAVLDMVRAGRDLEALDLRQRRERPGHSDEDELLRWLLAGARLHSHLRDFATAHRLLDEARDLAPSNHLVAFESAWTAEDEDRPDQALELCRAAIAAHPGVGLLREQECWLLIESGLGTALIPAIATTRAVVQCTRLDSYFAQLLLDAGRAEEARQLVQEILDEHALDRAGRSWHQLLLLRIHRTLGNDEDALRSAEALGTAGADTVTRLRAFHAAGSKGGRVVLPVPYVRQDHLTCSPATMVALLSFHGVAAAQREIAEQITYDGTPSFAEWQWANDRGLKIFFFQFDTDVARRLIDLGLPFAISTRSETSGHRQAVVGYDRALDTFVLRDPGVGLLLELPAKHLMSKSGARGGDCALLLPELVAARVPVDQLPQAKATLELHRLRQDYELRRIADADARAARLLLLPPSLVKWEAEIAIARERGDRRRHLQLWREQYERNAEDPYWQFGFATELRQQGQWEECQRLLDLHHQRGSPHLALLVADGLRHAAATRAQAEWLVRRAVRRLPRQAAPLRQLADVLWDEVPRREMAAEYYRLAACLDRHDEGTANAYFLACWHLGRAGIGLAWLRQRFEEFGGRRSGPGATLAGALDLMHNRTEAVDVLRLALSRQEDPAVREQLFDLLVDGQQWDAAEAVLDRDHALWRPLARELARYRLLRLRGRQAEAVACLDAAASLDPTSTSVQQQRLQALLERDGKTAAIDEAGRLVREHGDDPRLMVTVLDLYDHLQERARAESLLRRIVAEHPREWWLQGRLAQHLLTVGQPAEALQVLRRLQEVMSDSDLVWCDTARALEQLDDLEGARLAAERAQVAKPESSTALRRRIALAPGPEEAKAVLLATMASVRSSPRPIASDLLEAVVGLAADHLDRSQVEDFLAGLQTAFPSQPEIAAARARWLREHDAVAAAGVAAQLAADRPWVAEYALLHASCLRASGKRRDEQAALQRLIDRNPAYGPAYANLTESLEQEGRTHEAMAVCERGLQSTPGHAVLHGMRASLLWDFGDRNNALEAVGRATELDRHYSWAARTQVRWLSECGRDDDALAAADDFLRANPTTALAHDLRALALEALGRHDDRVVALQRALDFDPRSVAVRLRLLRALTELKRFDAARPVIETGLALLGRHPDLLLADIRIDRERGDLVQARERLQGLLREQPDFTGGWERLIIWCDEEGRADDILAWYRQPPAALAREARLPAYASDILWKRGQRTEAVQALQEALQLEPDYFWARDRLAEWLLEQHRPPEVLALLPEHASPDQVPFHTAARLAQAAAMTGDQVRAETFFERLLRDPSPDVDLLFAADRTLLSRQSSRQRELLRRTLATAKQPRVRESCLLVLAGRGDRRRFFARIGPFLASLPSTGREGPLGRLLYSASRQFGDRPVAAWAAVNLKPPIRDVDAWGCIAFALSGKRGSKVLLRIAGDYRRPGVRGWMLANYVGALHNCKRFDEMTTVARYALAEVPQDHSVWWHRRYLAEAALRRGDFEECRRLAEMPTEEFPTIRVEMEAMQVLARMRQTKGWFARRRLLHAALPSLLQQWRRADAERREAKKPARFELSSWFLRCIPTVDAALLLYGRNARPWLERRARRRSPPPT